jgi:hypothetical protein
MSRFKDWMMARDEQGWSCDDEHVCEKCVNDYALAEAIRADQDPDESCDFCGRSPAAPLSTLLALFVSGLRREYGNPDNEGVFWDRREGGYQAETIDSWDLIERYAEALIGDGLLEAVRDAVDHAGCAL